MSHENLNREQRIEGSSDRSFGLVFAAGFTLIATWPLLHGHALRWWALAVAAACAAIALTHPRLLSGANRLWTRFGVFLGNVVGPIAIGALFFLIVAPLGLVMRLSGKDPLRLKLERAADSYWLPRKPPGPPPNSLTNQF